MGVTSFSCQPPFANHRDLSGGTVLYDDLQKARPSRDGPSNLIAQNNHPCQKTWHQPHECTGPNQSP